MRTSLVCMGCVDRDDDDAIVVTPSQIVIGRDWPATGARSGTDRVAVSAQRLDSHRAVFAREVWLADLRTTTVYTHVLNRGGRGVRSPLDDLP